MYAPTKELRREAWERYKRYWTEGSNQSRGWIRESAPEILAACPDNEIIEEAIKFHTQKKTIDSVGKKETTTISEEDTKQTTADIDKERDEYVYTEEDFQVKSSPDAVERAIKKAESGSTEDYDNITKFWKWLASEKDLNDYFKTTP